MHQIVKNVLKAIHRYLVQINAILFVDKDIILMIIPVFHAILDFILFIHLLNVLNALLELIQIKKEWENA